MPVIRQQWRNTPAIHDSVVILTVFSLNISIFVFCEII
ncbi:hypothetical protein LHGZ1_2791 [Laribacter hongkongensis]|uniref:Uncharacterized protein n=1 Tax=Laribacter hongkongensis TaxID=168471 RepID=A0A248LLT0_9NEIS|nr:hypothetical protein LHGZ1_2791 [Laribacter hongkongensis]